MGRLLVGMLVVLGVMWLVAEGSSKPAGTQPTADEVRKDMLRGGPPVTPLQRPGRKVKAVKRQSIPRMSSRADARTGQKLLPEGHYIADRRGRLLREGDQLVFVFESDGKALADPPLALLPNRWLERMETDVTASPEPMVFQASGEVTTYRGRNYLLLRKVLIERRTRGGYSK